MAKHIKSFNAPLSRVSHVIDEWVYKEEYRHILKYRYLYGKTFEEIAGLMLMSVTSVKDVIYSYENIISKHL